MKAADNVFLHYVFINHTMLLCDLKLLDIKKGVSLAFVFSYDLIAPNHLALARPIDGRFIIIFFLQVYLFWIHIINNYTIFILLTVEVTKALTYALCYIYIGTSCSFLGFLMQCSPYLVALLCSLFVVREIGTQNLHLRIKIIN